jgi:YesN/AraC family two-component response regulator
MPEMDGYQLANKLVERYPKLKIQLISGFTDDRHLENINDELHVNLLYKPINSITLVKRIRELLDEK